MASPTTATREYFVAHCDTRMHLDSDHADCLRLFPSRLDAERAAEVSADEAVRRYWWGTGCEDDRCTVKTNDEGEKAFVCRAEQHETTFVLRRITASVVGDVDVGGNEDKDTGVDGGLQFACGIVVNNLLGGNGAVEFTSTVDHGCVFVGPNKDAVKSAAVRRAREFAHELTREEPMFFSSWVEADDGDLLVVKEGERPRRAGQPPQEGGDACLTLRVETAPNPDYDYDEDGADTDDFVPFTCSVIKVVELPIGKPPEAEYASKSFFHEWTKFPRAATPEMERCLERRREESRRQLREAVERSRNGTYSRVVYPWRARYLEEMRRIRREREPDANGNAGTAENSQDGS